MVYKYVLEEDFTFQSPILNKPFFSDWLVIEKDGKVFIPKGYSWDGCSPKFNFLDLLFGTPDGAINPETKKPMTYYASLIHDAIYQYKIDVDISRLETDLLFGMILKDDGFLWTNTYYRCVRMFGGFYGEWKVK